MLANKLKGSSEDKTYIEDVFSTYLYTGNGSTQTITNGIDISGKGGMVWMKQRAGGATSGQRQNTLFNTARGNDVNLSTNTTQSEGYGYSSLFNFTSSGFTLGNQAYINESGATYASWTFRKAPKFFDVVTYTGNGVAGRQIPHSLGVAPGMIVIKSSSTTWPWIVWHRSNNTQNGLLNTTDAFSSANTAGYFGNNTSVVQPTALNFTIGSYAGTNELGQTYVAYLFAHDTTTDGLIQCGSFTDSATVNLGWEPQYVLIKNTTSAESWYVIDTMRGFNVNTYSYLIPNSSSAEGSSTGVYLTNNGFSVSGLTGTYIYMAIRRGPMRTPTDGTNVFAPVARTGTGATVTTSTGVVPDLAIVNVRNSSTQGRYFHNRLLGQTRLSSTDTTAEASNSLYPKFDVSSGIQLQGSQYNSSGASMLDYYFSRAPGFFDVVCYTGDGVAGRYLYHSLNAAPEMVIIKSRSTTGDWLVSHSINMGGLMFKLNSTATGVATGIISDASYIRVFNAAAGPNNTTGTTYVAYLFASCPGVSKVGSYTGNGTSQTIDCGFINGARFVLIKRTDSTGDWYVWDTARGIVSANDPHLSLNTTAAEVTTNDSVDPQSTGFIVNQVAATNVNVSGASYIYLSIS